MKMSQYSKCIDIQWNNLYSSVINGIGEKNSSHYNKNLNNSNVGQNSVK